MNEKSQHYSSTAQYTQLPSNGWKTLQCPLFLSDGCWGINCHDVGVASASWLTPLHGIFFWELYRALTGFHSFERATFYGWNFPLISSPTPCSSVCSTSGLGFSVESHPLQEAVSLSILCLTHWPAHMLWSQGTQLMTHSHGSNTCNSAYWIV